MKLNNLKSLSLLFLIISLHVLQVNSTLLNKRRHMKGLKKMKKMKTENKINLNGNKLKKMFKEFFKGFIIGYFSGIIGAEINIYKYMFENILASCFNPVIHHFEAKMNSFKDNREIIMKLNDIFTGDQQSTFDIINISQTGEEDKKEEDSDTGEGIVQFVIPRNNMKRPGQELLNHETVPTETDEALAICESKEIAKINESILTEFLDDMKNRMNQLYSYFSGRRMEDESSAKKDHLQEIDEKLKKFEEKVKNTQINSDKQSSIDFINRIKEKGLCEAVKAEHKPTYHEIISAFLNSAMTGLKCIVTTIPATIMSNFIQEVIEQQIKDAFMQFVANMTIPGLIIYKLLIILARRFEMVKEFINRIFKYDDSLSDIQISFQLGNLCGYEMFKGFTTNK